LAVTVSVASRRSVAQETEETRQAYLDMPVDHPFHLIDNPDDEGIDEG
jgi:hypothetical protein